MAKKHLSPDEEQAAARKGAPRGLARILFGEWWLIALVTTSAVLVALAVSGDGWRLRNVAIALVVGGALGVLFAFLRGVPVPSDVRLAQVGNPKQSLALSREQFLSDLDHLLSGKRLTTLSLALIELEEATNNPDQPAAPAPHRLVDSLTELLRAELRGKDSLGQWSAHALAVLMPGVSGLMAGYELHHIQRHLTDAVRAESDELSPALRVQVGLATWQKGEPPSALIARAEQALATAREQGEPLVFLSW